MRPCMVDLSFWKIDVGCCGLVYLCSCFLFSCDVAWTSFSFGFLAAAGARLLMDVSKTSCCQVRGCRHSARCRFVLGALV